jgi:hypothetical protein
MTDASMVEFILKPYFWCRLGCGTELSSCRQVEWNELLWWHPPHPDYPMAYTKHTAYVVVMKMCIEPLWDWKLHCGAIQTGNIFEGGSSLKPCWAGWEAQGQLCHLFGALLKKLVQRMDSEDMFWPEVLLWMHMRMTAFSVNRSCRCP